MGEINWRKPFGRDFPQGFLYQNGKRYDQSGNEVDKNGNIIIEEPPPEKERPKPSKTTLKKTDLVAALDDMGIDYDPTASANELAEILKKA
jgi:hypothetical protein